MYVLEALHPAQGLHSLRMKCRGLRSSTKAKVFGLDVPCIVIRKGLQSYTRVLAYIFRVVIKKGISELEYGLGTYFRTV